MVFFARLFARLIILGSVSWWLYQQMELSGGTFSDGSIVFIEENLSSSDSTTGKTILVRQPGPQHYDENRSAETDYPSWFQPNESQDNRNLDYRLSTLPFTGDRLLDSYLVVPKVGAVAPIHTMKDTDYQTLLGGTLVDYNSYFERGVLQHPGTPGPELGTGNFVLAGHTSYYRELAGDYKTFMQFLILLHPGDLILIFQKNNQGIFDRYMYRVAGGYKVDANDISILDQSVDNPTLTLYGCYPFGSISHRRVINATIFDPLSDS